MSTKQLEEYRNSILDAMTEISKYYVGNPETVVKIMAAVLSSGHVLLKDFPGIGKTFIVKLFARVMGMTSKRIQFTPDLLPSDIVGTKVWKQNLGEFQTIKGPVFANLILADEINRAPPKTQSALLEAMEERQVTIEGETMLLDRPFIVLATQNPVELEGTYPLPEAQMDRFMIELTLGYPTDDIEVLRRRISWQSDDPSSTASIMLDSKELLEIQKYVESEIKVDKDILEYISEFAKCRTDERVLAGPSPRGLISLLRISKAIAFIDGRDFVIPDDIKKVARDVLGHRVILKPELTLEDIDGERIVSEYLVKIQVPK
ncbi:MAG: MoxR family ATPase [Candidatus Thermoplasmatota archaeon]|jgi:MoxR-like ATPase|nr:MoxR family ATPase [Candidatus Thermoplasmatota archaeon]MCL5799728.1 MoxR family ATPase [Candidatus Thermoplasmatota archaeon]